MEGELGSGARIAIALIVVGVIIGIVFVILGFTRGATNQGVGTVQNAMDQMQTSTFDDYDQQIISGTQVLSAIKLFEGRPVGIIVITTLSKKAGYGMNYGAQFLDSVSSGTTMYQMTVDSSMSTTFSDTGDSELTKETGKSYYTENLRTNTSGTMTYNMDTLETKKTGTAKYIRPTAKFLGELIKDSSGTITGVCFTQQ
jgi:hypothetical protein